MKLKISGAQYSKISAIGENVKRLERESGKSYLLLNQGVNAVVSLDLSQIIPTIDFSSKTIQNYAPIKGRDQLKQAINNEYFQGTSVKDNILITNGGMSGLDLVFQSIDINEIYVPAFYWGSYFNIMKIRNQKGNFYEDFQELEQNILNYKNKAVIICDPNNPIGDKFDDFRLLQLIKELNRIGCIVIVDSPYRKVFINDDSFFKELAQLKNVIIVESFSKSLGLSGQRIGFIHTQNKELNKELAIRLMYASNGVNAFAQLLVEYLLTTPEGRKAIDAFKRNTTDDIQKNMQYLKAKHILADEFYHNSIPMGIFAVVNKSEEQLLSHLIASVSLAFFTQKHKEKANNYARICVSVPHKQFVEYFQHL